MDKIGVFKKNRESKAKNIKTPKKNFSENKNLDSKEVSTNKLAIFDDEKINKKIKSESDKEELESKKSENENGKEPLTD